jgi:hypothetical protein
MMARTSSSSGQPTARLAALSQPIGNAFNQGYGQQRCDDQAHAAEQIDEEDDGSTIVEGHGMSSGCLILICALVPRSEAAR